MLEKKNPVRTAAWNDLRTHHHKVMRHAQMKDLFREDPARFQRYSLWFEDILLDYSKHIITDETLFLLTELARETGVSDAMEKMFSGDLINETETDEGLHRIDSITNYTTAVLDRYKASGTETDAVHYTAEQMPAGHGQVKLGINKLVEGVQLRVMVCPRHGTGAGTGQPTIAKITGISLGYIPLGEKILEATGG